MIKIFLKTYVNIGQFGNSRNTEAKQNFFKKFIKKCRRNAGCLMKFVGEEENQDGVAPGIKLFIQN